MRIPVLQPQILEMKVFGDDCYLCFILDPWQTDIHGRTWNPLTEPLCNLRILLSTVHQGIATIGLSYSLKWNLFAQLQGFTSGDFKALSR